MSATQLLDAYAKKSLSPVEVTLTALDRIEKLDSMLNAFCFLDGEAAMQSARASEARWMRGTPIGVIDGVTATIKDVVLTKGWPTRKGSRHFG
jgi:aspartyl-tRNA(Asn)/glutamyl-tRNA(Gln) amidotransferase subunit A